ncbi:hypothetical protein CWI38_2558p0010, partial [Hamiltosporidium tvaerminnensis]
MASKEIHETGERSWIEHLNNVIYAYSITVHSSTNKSKFMLFFGQPVEENAADTQWILEIASDVHEEFIETLTTITTIIADDLGSDSRVLSDINFDKEDFDMNTKTKRAPFDSFYDNSVFTVTAILMNNMIEVKNNDGDTRTVFSGVTKR